MSLTRESQHVRLLPLLEEHPKTPAVAVDGVRNHPRGLHAPIHKSPPEHLFGQFGLGAHPHLIGHPGPLATLLILGPLLRQIQLPIDEGLPPTGGVGQKHPNLAVLPLADSAGVLALYTYALISLLDEACLVDDETTLRVRQMLDDVLSQVVSNCVGIPAGSSKEVLDTIGRGVSRYLGQLPRVLALSLREQATQIVLGPLAHFGAGKVIRETIAHRLQLLTPRSEHLPVHRLCHHVLLCRQREHDAKPFCYLQL